jgi:hypothetical protein
MQRSNKSLAKLHQKKLLVICSFFNNEASSKSRVFYRPHVDIFYIFYCKSSERILGTDDLVRRLTNRLYDLVRCLTNRSCMLFCYIDWL